MATLVHNRVQAARNGTNPTVICRMQSGWAVLGDQQFLPGYALLLPDPVVPSRNDLDGEQRALFLLDMTALGDTLLLALGAHRVNYAIYGNHDPSLHAHLFPRYDWEPEEYCTGPAWLYPQQQRHSAPFDPERHGQLLRTIQDLLVNNGCLRLVPPRQEEDD